MFTQRSQLFTAATYQGWLVTCFKLTQRSDQVLSKFYIYQFLSQNITSSGKNTAMNKAVMSFLAPFECQKIWICSLRDFQNPSMILIKKMMSPLSQSTAEVARINYNQFRKKKTTELLYHLAGKTPILAKMTTQVKRNLLFTLDLSLFQKENQRGW